MHESQQVLIDNDKELRIKLKLFITHDFYMELLFYGENMKVIQPQNLIDDLKATLKDVLKRYKSNINL